MPELDWSVLLEYLFENKTGEDNVLYYLFSPLLHKLGPVALRRTADAEAWAPPMQPPGPPSKRSQWDGLWGSGFHLELRKGYKVAGRWSCWRQIMVLSEHKSLQEFPGRSDLSKVLNYSPKHQMGGDTHYWCQPCIRPHPGTSAYAISLNLQRTWWMRDFQISTLTD